MVEEEEEDWRVIAEFPAYAVSNKMRVKRIEKYGHPGVPGEVMNTRYVRGKRTDVDLAYVRLSKNGVAYSRGIRKLWVNALLGGAPRPKPVVPQLKQARPGERRALKKRLRYERARELREQGWKLADIAKDVGIHISLVSRVLSGKRR